MIQKVDNLIVGAGLAGVWTAFQLLKRNKSFALYDVSSLNHSSRVAAGIYNPMLPKRQKLSFGARSIYPEVGNKYHEMEQYLHTRFCYHTPSLYILESARELNDWAALSETERFRDFMCIQNERISDAVVSDFGYLNIEHSGWVDIPHMLDTFVERIAEPNLFYHETFMAAELKASDSGFTYRDIEARHVIFCQGTGISENPFTRHLVLKPAKGELLLIESDSGVREAVPQNGVFMLPVGHNRYRIGSNFTWEDLSTNCTEAARDEIIQKFTRWFKGPFDIVNQVAGIRPSSLDRRPMLGRLDTHPLAFICNGLGSKGVSLAPYYSEMLVRCIYDEVKVDSDVDVKRFF